jgi:hypothetical protein
MPQLACRPCRLVVAIALLAAPVQAQTGSGSTRDSARGPELSGVLFGNYQYHVEDGPRASGNEFVLDRAYLTLRSSLGERTSVRLTSDLFRNGSEGYDLRLKYAYLQYQLHRGTRAFVRAGILQTVEIEHEETFWPRWLGPVSTDRFGFFSSADVGVSAGLTLPDSLGEVYAAVTNGRGFRDAGTDDRFKDYAARLTLTPLAGRDVPRALRGLSISPWYHKGDTASTFGPGRSPAGNPDDYLGTVHAGRTRDRYGIIGGLRDPRLTLGVGVAEYRREEEGGQNTTTSPVVLSERTSRLVTAIAVARPLPGADADTPHPLGVVLRYDRFRPDVDADPYVHFVAGGVTYDVSSRISLALDYQEQLPREGASPVQYAPSQVYFVHLMARF